MLVKMSTTPQPTAMFIPGNGRPTLSPETAMLTRINGCVEEVEVNRMLRLDSGRMFVTLMAHKDQGRVEPPSSKPHLTRMMRPDSGRTQATVPVKAPEKHPGVNCDGCNSPVGDKVRFKCLDCADFDLCANCEGNNAIINHHFDGKHLFAKIRDSAAIGGNDAVNAYKKH